MKDLGLAKQKLGMKVIKDRSKKLIWLSQEKYIEKTLKRFNMDKEKTCQCFTCRTFQVKHNAM